MKSRLYHIPATNVQYGGHHHSNRQQPFVTVDDFFCQRRQILTTLDPNSLWKSTGGWRSLWMCDLAVGPSINPFFGCHIKSHIGPNVPSGDKMFTPFVWKNKLTFYFQDRFAIRGHVTDVTYCLSVGWVPLLHLFRGTKLEMNSCLHAGWQWNANSVFPHAACWRHAVWKSSVQGGIKPSQTLNLIFSWVSRSPRIKITQKKKKTAGGCNYWGWVYFLCISKQ